MEIPSVYGIIEELGRVRSVSRTAKMARIVIEARVVLRARTTAIRSPSTGLSHRA